MNRMKFCSLLTALVVALALLAGCGSETAMEQPAPDAGKAEAPADRDFGKLKGKKIMVAYYSRADENTGVGVIEKGNTEILAERIAEDLGADIYKIEPEKPYPKDYKEATDVAKEEKAKNARPAVKGEIPDLSGYDVIFLGYPIWWGDLPMTVYTFLEHESFRGKIIVPFCTHEGSGIGSTPETIVQLTRPLGLLPPLEMRGTKAQKERDEAKAEVDNWLEGLGKDDSL
ncbi:flavodoxin [Selenomonas sp. TAMA-11512]|uniref:flavodoxin n=1 Tax=Selenomonas sp. TAMA-11512 TaxID=3095337 RepID=UPI00308F3AEF|nr:flavodoxin [Selenomonas sp. TAMA-11512]